MSAQEEQYTKYLNENGILPRLLQILEQLVNIDPLPTDPLMEILHALGCPLIPQAQMKALERKVSRAQDELRYLRRVLIELGGQDELYDSDTDENEYVGHVGEMGAAPLYSPDSADEEEAEQDDQDCSMPRRTPQPQYVLEASIAIREEQPQHAEYDEEQPCCSHSIQANAQQF
ncbi:uncharacterized protein LOC135433915 [Drosophila montana]|uniref:uncharacterized protein LOC135433915 n=1 Tax=Drosophila montana TaxID=40370 RepID=UPI00313B3C51